MTPTASAPSLPDGVVVVVKSACETCHAVVPVLGQLSEATTLHVYTQDDPAFPEAFAPTHDEDLAVSWFHDIETVPTVIKIAGGAEVERTVGWSRDAWAAITGVDGLGPDLPPMRP
ncbi:MAG: thioredoxin family protein, partial [Ilumatobacter sp.]